MGWSGVLPIGRAPNQKSPPPGDPRRGISFTGHGAPDPSGADVQTWLMGPEAGYNIGLRLPPGVLGLDVDAYGTKPGAQTLAELVAKYGPLPDTWITGARTDGISGIRLYEVPLELGPRHWHNEQGSWSWECPCSEASTANLSMHVAEEAVARHAVHRRAINWPGEAGKGIEIIQAGHRYAVVSPSTNPEAGNAPYRWRRSPGGPMIEQEHDIPGPGELPRLPEAWVRGLALPYDRTEKSDIGGPEMAAWWSALRPGEPCPVIHRVWTRAVDNIRNEAGSRHETARDSVRAILAAGGAGHRGAPAAVELLAQVFAEAVGPDRIATGEWTRLLSGAVKLAATKNPAPQQHCEHDEATGIQAPEGFTVPTAAPAIPVPAAVGLNLPEEFWAARESLKRIRQAAHSRVRSGDVVFYGMLCRLAAMAPHRLRADTGVASPASLNLFAAIVGPSGGGKSSGLGVSRELIKADRDLEEFPLGSGEGVAEAYMGETMEPTGQMAKDGSEKQQKVRKQVRHNALFHADEGNALNKLIERTGSTVGETLRSAWTGETIGQKNGRVETTRTVPNGSYSAGMMIGYQPSTVLPLLADAEAGTPQRFLYCWAVDPAIPSRSERVPWPGEMVSPFAPGVPTSLPPAGTVVFSAAPPPGVSEPITFVDSIRDGLYDIEHAKNTGTLPAGHPMLDPFRSQHSVLKVKVAALLALLESRRRVTEADWELAQLVIDTSDRVREYLQGLGEAAAREEARRADETHARRAVMAHAAVGQHEQSAVSAAVSRLAVALAQKVHAAGGEGLMRSAARKTVASTSRPLFGDAVTLAVEYVWIAENGSRLLPGASLPALGAGGGSG